MSRDPTAGEIEDIRRLLAQTGGVAELRRWIKLARPAPAKVQRKRGRRRGVSTFTGDAALLLYAAALQKHYPSLEIFEAIKEVVESQWCQFRGHDLLIPHDPKVASQAPSYTHRFVDGGPDVVLISIKPGAFRQTIFGASPPAHAKRLLGKLGGRSLAQFRAETCANPNQSVADRLAVRMIEDYVPRFSPGMGWLWGYTGPKSKSDSLSMGSKLRPKRSVLIIRRQAF